MVQFNLTLRPKVAQLLNKYRLKSDMINQMILYCLNYKSKDYQTYLIDDNSLGKPDNTTTGGRGITNTMDIKEQKPSPTQGKGANNNSSADLLLTGDHLVFDSKGRPIGRRY